MYSTYLRLGVHALDTPREVIKAARSKLLPRVWYSRKERKGRHNYYRCMLDHHGRARKLYLAVVRGEI